MRKLKLQVQMTADGFVGGPNGELDWLSPNWDDALIRCVGELTDPVDTILLGRKMTDGFVNHWAAVAADPSNPEYSAGKKFTDTPKMVFSRTLKHSQWNNTTLASRNIVDEVNALKQKSGGDIIVYGGASFVSSLIEHGSIDEFNLFVNPVVIGRGLTIFAGTQPMQKLTLITARQFDCGIVLHKYKKA
ncbi:MAG: dihydrofolate reductase family protein [Bacteroidota bacterium]